MREPARRFSRLRSVARDDSGASALEMSIVAPGLILLIFFGIQSGLYYYGRTVAVQAAREAAREYARSEQHGQVEAMIASFRA